jgi:hypothetical protein
MLGDHDPLPLAGSLQGIAQVILQGLDTDFHHSGVSLPETAPSRRDRSCASSGGGRRLPATGNRWRMTRERWPAQGEARRILCRRLPAAGESPPSPRDRLPVTGEPSPLPRQGLPLTGKPSPRPRRRSPVMGEDLPRLRQSSPNLLPVYLYLVAPGHPSGRP